MKISSKVKRILLSQTEVICLEDKEAGKENIAEEKEGYLWWKRQIL